MRTPDASGGAVASSSTALTLVSGAGACTVRGTSLSPSTHHTEAVVTGGDAGTELVALVVGRLSRPGTGSGPSESGTPHPASSRMSTAAAVARLTRPP